MTRPYRPPEPRAQASLLQEILKHDTLKTLTLTEPFGTLVALKATQEDGKGNETRSWGTDHTGPVGIHTAKGFSRDDEDLCGYEPIARALTKGGYTQDLTRKRNTWNLPLGQVIAVAWLERVVRLGPTTDPLRDYPPEPERSFGKYAPNRCIWQFSAIYRLATPLPVRGALMLWDWTPPESFWAEIQAALDTSRRSISATVQGDV